MSGAVAAAMPIVSLVFHRPASKERMSCGFGRVPCQRSGRPNVRPPERGNAGRSGGQEGNAARTLFVRSVDTRTFHS